MSWRFFIISGLLIVIFQSHSFTGLPVAIGSGRNLIGPPGFGVSWELNFSYQSVLGASRRLAAIASHLSCIACGNPRANLHFRISSKHSILCRSSSFALKPTSPFRKASSLRIC
jgi:hypothetical protein